MSDSLSPLPDFGDDAEELVFDDEPEAVAPAPVEETKPRRTPRKGRKGDESVSADTAPAPETIVSAEALVGAAAEEPAGGAPAPFPPHGAEPAGSTLKWLLGIVALATVSSCASLGGLLMVSRTLAHAQVDREQALTQRAALERIPGMVDKLDAASARLDAAAQKLATAAPTGAPATLADVHHEIDLLKLALAQRQPDGLSALNGNIRGGFQDLATRIDRMQDQIGQMRRVPAPSAGGPTVTVSRVRAHASE